MCLTLDSRFPGIYRAGYDILVWKRLREGWRKRAGGQRELVSPYQSSAYTLGKPKLDGRMVACSLSRMRRASVEETNRVTFHRGLHAYRSEKAAKRANTFDRIYPAIIPKGALFIVGRNDEVVCDQLVVQSRGWHIGQDVPERGDFSRHECVHRFESFTINTFTIPGSTRKYSRMGWRIKQ